MYILLELRTFPNDLLLPYKVISTTSRLYRIEVQLIEVQCDII